MTLQDYLNDADTIEREGVAAFEAATDAASLETARIAFLGDRQGRVKALQEALRTISKEDKPAAGKRFNEARTAYEPAEPVGVDLERDNLSFYPLLYWPMSQAEKDLSPAAVAKVDQFMREGGTILFDTRDSPIGGLGSSASPGACCRCSTPNIGARTAPESVAGRAGSAGTRGEDSSSSTLAECASRSAPAGLRASRSVQPSCSISISFRSDAAMASMKTLICCASMAMSQLRHSGTGEGRGRPSKCACRLAQSNIKSWFPNSSAAWCSISMVKS